MHLNKTLVAGETPATGRKDQYKNDATKRRCTMSPTSYSICSYRTLFGITQINECITNDKL